VKALPKGTKRLVAEEPLPFTGHDEANFIDGVISTCYRLVGSFEQEIRIDQVAGCVPRGTLGEIADKAFALAWNTRDLTCIQQAQILDILLSVASLLDAAKGRLQDAVDQSEEVSKQAKKAGA
jgi:ATP-dependent protease Clp ATPase subunit